MERKGVSDMSWKFRRQPLYLRVREDLIRRIQSGEYEVDHMIPSQKDLAELYQVSDITIRKAIELLCNDGYLYRIQGKGTFMAKRRINRVLNHMSFAEEMRSRGLEVESRVITLDVLKDRRVARELKILPTRDIVKIERLRLVDDKALAFETSYFPANLVSVPELQKVHDTHSLYAVLREMNLKASKAHDIYRADVLTDLRLCHLLQAQPGDPVLVVERCTFDEEEILFEYMESILRGDAYSIEVILEQ